MAGNNFLVGIGNVLNASSMTIETNNQAETNEEEGDKNSQKANATKVFAPSKRAYFQILLKRVFSLRPNDELTLYWDCLLYTSPSPRDRQKSRMPSSA